MRQIQANQSHPMLFDFFAWDTLQRPRANPAKTPKTAPKKLQPALFSWLEPVTPSSLLSTREAAAQMGVTPKSFLRYMLARGVRPAQSPHGKHQWLERDVARAITARAALNRCPKVSAKHVDDGAYRPLQNTPTGLEPIDVWISLGYTHGPFLTAGALELRGSQPSVWEECVETSRRWKRENKQPQYRPSSALKAAA